MNRHGKISCGLLGQGLVEYALLLMLVAVVVIIVLLLLGPVIGNIFSNITTSLQSPDGGAGGGSGDNVIVGATASRTGGGQGNSIKVDIVVSAMTTVTITDSQSGTSQSVTCNGSCSVTIGSVGDNAGVITVIDSAGGTVTTSYPARN